MKIRAIGGVRQTLSYQDFSMISIKYPPIEIVREFNMQYQNLLNQINHNIEENHKLSILRDTLLPKLMSGELNVEDVLVD